MARKKTKTGSIDIRAITYTEAREDFYKAYTKLRKKGYKANIYADLPPTLKQLNKLGTTREEKLRLKQDIVYHTRRMIRALEEGNVSRETSIFDIYTGAYYRNQQSEQERMDFLARYGQQMDTTEPIPDGGEISYENYADDFIRELQTEHKQRAMELGIHNPYKPWQTAPILQEINKAIQQYGKSRIGWNIHNSLSEDNIDAIAIVQYSSKQDQIDQNRNLLVGVILGHMTPEINAEVQEFEELSAGYTTPFDE